MELRLFNARGRDCLVNVIPCGGARRLRAVTQDGGPIRSVRLLVDGTPIGQTAAPAPITAESIINEDLEIHPQAGRIITEASTAYLDAQGRVVPVEHFEIFCGPTGNELSRRPTVAISPTEALGWKGVAVPVAEAVRKYVFCGAVQITHKDGIGYDFLYQIAEALVEAGALRLLADPVVLRRDGNKYRGFLCGRVIGDRYALRLLLSHQELKGGF